jgi:hypothetical protein
LSPIWENTGTERITSGTWYNFQSFRSLNSKGLSLLHYGKRLILVFGRLFAFRYEKNNMHIVPSTPQNDQIDSKNNKEEKKPCPDELIKKHSTDPDHIITDDDIKTLKTGEDCK